MFLGQSPRDEGTIGTRGMKTEGDAKNENNFLKNIRGGNVLYHMKYLIVELRDK